MKKKLYIIANSHIDPAWIWTRSAGYASYLNTMQSVVKIMEENDDLKFTCSSASLYRWIEQTAPTLFRKIKVLVAENRWEIVGGWEVQPDVIYSRQEPLMRQGFTAQKYFQEKFGKKVEIGYCVDSFGHNSGLPKILNQAGMTKYVFTRSQPSVPLLFNWKGDDGSAVTALKLFSYGTNNSMTREQLRGLIERHLNDGLERQVFFFGVGDHGGGIYRRQLAWIREFQQEYDLSFSTLTEYFQDVATLELPGFSGELGTVFRGCYGNCHEIKRKIARATRNILKAERLGTPAGELVPAWLELSFNHFHDILPGTSIRQVYEQDAFPAVGMVEHTAARMVDLALARLDQKADTTFMPEGGVMVWNPHPFPTQAIVAFDDFSDPNNSGTDFNALRSADGKDVPLQILPPATTFGPCGEPWGKLTAVVEVSAFGTQYWALARSGPPWTALGCEKQRDLLKKMSFPVFFDNYRTWGFELNKYEDPLGEASLLEVVEYVDGPVCSILRAKYGYKTSMITLDLAVYAHISEIGIKIKLDWHEPKCVLKLALDHCLTAPTFYTGGCASIDKREEFPDKSAVQWQNGRRGKLHPNSGEFPFIDWCAATKNEQSCGFFAPDLHACDHADNKLRITLLRSTLYADHLPFFQNDESGWTELGVSWRQLWYFELGGDIERIPLMAQSRLFTPEIRAISKHEADSQIANPASMPTFTLRNSVLTSARLTDSGKWCLTLCNYGTEEDVVLSNGITITIPEKAICVITV